METVNHVLGSHKGSRIKELKVDTFNTKGDDYYKEWFEFALTKEAMNHIKGSGLGQTSNQILLHGLKYLKELSLLRIRLTDQDFDLLVNNCPVLESLSIHSSVLEHVSIVGHSKLKHLHLFQPWSLRSLEIRDAINLVSFKCNGLLDRQCELQLSNIPKLVKLGYSECWSDVPHAELFLRMPSCISDQLHSIHLSTTDGVVCQVLSPSHSIIIIIK